MKITPREKRQDAAGGFFLSPRRVSPFLAWGDFHARSRFTRSTIPEEKWGTTRSLVLTFLQLPKLTWIGKFPIVSSKSIITRLSEGTETLTRLAVDVYSTSSIIYAQHGQVP